MNNQTKQNLFDNFLNEWGTQFGKIPYILKYIDTYPELKEHFLKFLPLISDDLNDSQLEWVSLVEQLDNPVDTVFFKPYWVPIQKLEYDIYIDLSSELMPVFKLGYFFFEPYRWYKIFLFKSIIDLLISVDDCSIDILNHLETNKDEATQIINNYFQERDRLGFSGQLKADTVEKDHLRIEIVEIKLSEDINNESGETDYDVEKDVEFEENSFEFIDNNTVILKGVEPYAIGLLPYEGKITLCEYDGKKQKLLKYQDRVKCFNAFLYLLCSKGMVKSYKINFGSETDSYAEYNNHKLTIHHTNVELLNSMKMKFVEIMNTF